jgi:hypothetical protein
MVYRKHSRKAAQSQKIFFVRFMLRCGLITENEIASWH